MKSAITVSLVEEARGGPFVFWDGLADACERAGKLGFDAIEVFAPSTDVINSAELKSMLEANGLALAALGTGAGMVKHGLSLSNPDAAHRAKAVAFVNDIVSKAGEFGASAIIGSMQGKWGGDTDKVTALSYLGEALNACGEHAKQFNVPLIYEPLNRYETNLCNTVADGVSLLESSSAENVTLLADLFHMNIEEVCIASALKAGGKHIGHVHFVDSNRRPATCGHMNYEPIAAALREINYEGYACAEALPFPDPQTAAENHNRRVQEIHGLGRFESMLLHQLIHPKINEVIGRAGHHGKILIADGNYPASSTLGPNAELVSLNLSPGVVTCNQILQALVTAIPIEEANTMMYETEGPYALTEDPPVWNDYRDTFKAANLDLELKPIEKWDFYEAVNTRDHVLTIQSADQQRFANLLLSIGVRM